MITPSLPIPIPIIFPYKRYFFITGTCSLQPHDHVPYDMIYFYSINWRWWCSIAPPLPIEIEIICTSPINAAS